MNFIQRTKYTEWAVSLVFGQFQTTEIWDSKDKRKKSIALLHKRSVTSLYKDYQHDFELFQLFQCGKEYDTLDVFIGSGKEL